MRIKITGMVILISLLVVLAVGLAIATVAHYRQQNTDFGGTFVRGASIGHLY